MSMRHVRQLRRAGVATLMAAALAFTATACGGDDDKPSDSASSSSQGSDGGKGDGNASPQPSETRTIASAKNDEGIEMVIQGAKRDDGGFLTLSGVFKNDTSDSFTTPVQWCGDEEGVSGAGPSFAAMILVDSKGKKRYYVLRDTDNRPLTTINYPSSIEPGKQLTFFAQFPAPPASTTSVDLQFPGFPNTKVELS